jgi:hypothetical protein
VRVAESGSVIVYGRRVVRGRLSNLSRRGMRVVRIAETALRCGCESVRVELHLDAPMDVRLLGDRSPTSALAWFTSAARAAS